MPYTVTRKKIEEILSNKPKITFKKIAKNPGVGLVNGLYATSGGVGGLTIIEAGKTHSEINSFSINWTTRRCNEESMSCQNYCMEFITTRN